MTGKAGPALLTVLLVLVWAVRWSPGQAAGTLAFEYGWILIAAACFGWFCLPERGPAQPPIGRDRRAGIRDVEGNTAGPPS